MGIKIKRPTNLSIVEKLGGFLVLPAKVRNVFQSSKGKSGSIDLSIFSLWHSSNKFGSARGLTKSFHITRKRIGFDFKVNLLTDKEEQLHRTMEVLEQQDAINCPNYRRPRVTQTADFLCLIVPEYEEKSLPLQQLNEKRRKYVRERNEILQVHFRTRTE